MTDMPSRIGSLTPAESARLRELERVVEKGLVTFVEVGEALLQIRDERLYRASHRRFEDYCCEHWDFSKARATQLISAAVTAVTLSPRPKNERQVRAVRSLKHPEQMRQAWQEASRAAAARGREPTADDVQSAVNKLRNREPVSGGELQPGRKLSSGDTAASVAERAEASSQPPSGCGRPGHARRWRVVGPWVCGTCHPPAREDIEWEQ